MKPDWKDAPGWATYVSQSLVGDWEWFEERPQLRQGVWQSEKRRQHAGYSGRIHAKFGRTFRLPIEPRPQTTNPDTRPGSEGQEEA